MPEKNSITQPIPMNKHWTRFLPEAGPIERQGHEQEKRLRQLSDLQHQYKLVVAEYKAEDISIKKLALKYWTDKEISQAMQSAQDSPL